MKMLDSFKIALLALALALSGNAMAQAPELAEGHPVQYTVVTGDTLWDIAARFLKDPWRWKEIWRQNPAIENPDLIYPGDQLVLRYDGDQPYLEHLSGRDRAARKTVKMTPAIYIEKLDDAIPAIPPQVIMPFLTDPRIIEAGGLSDAAYITEGVGGAIVMGLHDEAYARNINGIKGDRFKILRQGQALVDPDTKETVAYEAIYLGDAEILHPGDPARMRITKSTQEISPADRLVPAPKQVSFPYFQPEAFRQPLNARIITSYGGIDETGTGRVVTISAGEADGLKPGHVLQILREGGTSKDPVTGKSYSVPPEQTGVLMVFKAFSEASYALIMRSKWSIHVNDRVVNF